MIRISGQAVSGGNATVPVDAPIQPAQAFVDNIEAATFAIPNTGTLVLSNQEITYIKPGSALDGFNLYAYVRFVASLGGVPSILLDGNKITNTNAILAAIAAVVVDNSVSGGTLDLSGGTNAAPTGQGLIDKATLESNGWTVATN